MLSRTIAFCVVVACFVGSRPPLAAGDRYVALFADGKRVSHDEVREWHDTSAEPKIGDRKLFDPANPLRWLIDTEISLPPPSEAFVEMVGGDRLPGKVLEYRFGGESPYDQLPPHLVIDPAVPVQWPDPRQRQPARALTRWLRRVVWNNRGNDAYQPGNVFFLDGRQVAFRSLRWMPDGVRLLLPEGTSEVAFTQIAELHLARQDDWNAYFEQLALLSPGGSSRLLTVETDHGVRATASLERFQARNNGSHADHWFHGLQPAWSLDPLWLRHRTIRTRIYCAPHEVPLFRLEPAQVQQRSAFGKGWTWQANRNVQGGALRNGSHDYAWGLGVQAQCELTYQLHPLARSFRTRVGLDEVAGRGGCARGNLYWGSTAGAPAWQSPLLVGSRESFESSVLTVPQQAASSSASKELSPRLVLVADAAYEDRPVGADPFDIRDMLNWLEPLVELDASALGVEIGRRIERMLPAWQGWTLAESESAPAMLVNYWDNTDARNQRFQPLIAARQKLLLLSRTVTVTPEQRNLLLAVSRFSKETAGARLQVQIDGRQVAQFDVPERRPPAEPDPLFVPLEKYLGKEITLGVAQLPLGPQSLIDWRGLHLADRWPGLATLFEDEGQLAEQLRLGTDTPSLDSGDKYSGNVSLQFMPVAGSDPHRWEVDFAICENPRLGEFRYLRFAWKKPGKGRICLSLEHDRMWGPDENVPKREQLRRSFRYEAGQGEPSYGAALRLGSLPKGWTLVTRDLFADFGAFALTGISLSAPDGDAAQFDHIYLGRSPTDFERIPMKK